jgi:hypothetical protein
MFPFQAKSFAVGVFAAVLTVLVFSSAATAASFWCTTAIDEVQVTGDGNSWVVAKVANFGNLDWQVCKLDTTFGQISPDACKAMLTELIDAKTARLEVSFVFNDTYFTSCTAVPAMSDLSSSNLVKLVLK